MGDEINFPKNMIIKIFRESVQTQVGVIMLTPHFATCI